MSSDVVSHLLQRIDQPDLVRILSEELTGSELNSLLLEVFNRRLSDITPAQLMNQYQQNRFVKPADLPVIDLKRMELDLLTFLERQQFQAVELSPVAPLGACSVVAVADQKKIISALRGTEVLADATNSIALHASDLIRTRRWEPKEPGDTLDFCTVQRHVRAQPISGKGFTPHFKIACLVTCGTDRGSYSFEKESLCHHVVAMRDLYRDHYKVEDVSFRFLCRGGYAQPQDLASRVREFIVGRHPDIRIDLVQSPEKTIAYYQGIQYKIDIRVNGKTFEIGDGGFVDWTQKLLQNRKERMLSTGIGFEFMYRILQGQL